MKITEKHVQALVMREAMINNSHIAAIPNSTQIFPWEADVLSATKAWLLHEFEVKLNMADYRADFKKSRKHQILCDRDFRNSHYAFPSYFWYVTCGFEIEPPEYAGWAVVTRNDSKYAHYEYGVTVKKPAPRLHQVKANDRVVRACLAITSYRLQAVYMNKYFGAPRKMEIVY